MLRYGTDCQWTDDAGARTMKHVEGSAPAQETSVATTAKTSAPNTTTTHAWNGTRTKQAPRFHSPSSAIHLARACVGGRGAGATGSAFTKRVAKTIGFTTFSKKHSCCGCSVVVSTPLQPQQFFFARTHRTAATAKKSAGVDTTRPRRTAKRPLSHARTP